MSIIRKIAAFAASLIVGIVGTVLTVGPSTTVADCGWQDPVPCRQMTMDGIQY
ncbi:hypothetical protein [Actinophytocola sp.]|uniref:hypothetical protein n=1 Tax=Actinophytocola sp. TaxID=1872138 RepID=UPI0025BDBD09|nr:hypothetical protein [Actinophytocola sp.]